MSAFAGPTPEEIAAEYGDKAAGRYGIETSEALKAVILKHSKEGEDAWAAMYHPETLQVILDDLKEFGEKVQKIFAEDIAHGINIHMMKTGATMKEAFEHMTPAINGAIDKVFEFGEKLDPSMLNLINQAKELGVELDISTSKFTSALTELMSKSDITSEKLENMRHNAKELGIDFKHSFGSAFDNSIREAIRLGKTLDKDVIAYAKEIGVESKVSTSEFTDGLYNIINASRVSSESLKNLIALAKELKISVEKITYSAMHRWGKKEAANFLGAKDTESMKEETKQFKSDFNEKLADAIDDKLPLDEFFQATIDGINNTISSLKDSISSVNDEISGGMRNLFGLQKQLWQLNNKADCIKLEFFGVVLSSSHIFTSVRAIILNQVVLIK